tara:strand:- start:29003 stop:29194 length:192 start_codon:yes stop_codon:yes gene_type:complete
MQCEILTSFAGPMGSFSAGETADVPDQYIADLTNAGFVKPVGKVAKRKAVRKKAEKPSGEGDD